MSIRSSSPSASVSLTERALAVIALALLAARASMGFGGLSVTNVALAIASVVLAAVAIGLGTTAAASIASLVALLLLASFAPLPWQAMMALALGGFAVTIRLLPRVAPSPSWRERGSLPLGWTMLVGGVTPVALLGWVLVLHPDLSDLHRMVPRVPLALLVTGAIAFAIVNALLEELVWRGVLQDRLTHAFGPTLAIVLQALSFGLQHAHGFPRGVVGVVLAGTWALMLGLLRRRSRGLLAPVLAHVVADATIAILVLSGVA